MFSLNFDLFFADLKSVKGLARMLNREKPHASGLDPRELQRIRDELRVAREKAKAQAIRHRYHLI
jgi:hypothetical protein